MKENENFESCSLLGCDNGCSGQKEFGHQLRELSFQEVLCSSTLLPAVECFLEKIFYDAEFVS